MSRDQATLEGRTTELRTSPLTWPAVPLDESIEVRALAIVEG